MPGPGYAPNPANRPKKKPVPKYKPPTRGGGYPPPPRLPATTNLFNIPGMYATPNLGAVFPGYTPSRNPTVFTIPTETPVPPPETSTFPYTGLPETVRATSVKQNALRFGAEAATTEATGAPGIAETDVDNAMEFYFSKGGRYMNTADYEILNKMVNKLDDQQWDDFNQRTRSIELWGKDPGLMGWDERRAFENRLYREQAMQRPGDTRTRFGQAAGTGTPVQGAGVGSPSAGQGY